MRELLGEKELRALARLRLSWRRPPGEGIGGHLSSRTGYSLEFADFRPYQPGDDFRLVDWTAYARLRKLLVRVYKREVEAPLYLFLDTSASMGKGRPVKLGFAARLAAALSFVAHRSQDRFGLVSFSARIEGELPPKRGKSHLATLFRLLSTLEARGETDLNTALTQWASRGAEPGICFVLSDFLCEGGWHEGISALLHGRHAVAMVQVLSPQDLDPGLRGELELVDVELGKSRRLVASVGALRLYREALAAWNEALSSYALERGIPYFLFSSRTSPVEACWILLAR